MWYEKLGENGLLIITDYLEKVSAMPLVILDNRYRIVECNRGFQQLLKLPEKPLGEAFENYLLRQSDQPPFNELLEDTDTPFREVSLTLASRGAAPTGIVFYHYVAPSHHYLFADRVFSLDSEVLQEFTVLSNQLTNMNRELSKKNRELEISMREQEGVQKALRQSETLLNVTQELAQIGGWEYDVENKNMYWTREAYRIHGFDPEQLPPASLDLIHLGLSCFKPEHRPLVEDALQRCVTEGIPFDLEYPFTAINGEQIWVRIQARAIEEENRIIKLTGNIMNITRRKQAEQKIDEYTMELELKGLELEEEIRERRKVGLALKKAKEEAEKANALKSEFLANMSHEIRTPMNVIIGMSELLYSSELNKEQKEFIGMVKDSAESLLAIINDILDFSKVEAGRLELEMDSFNLTSLVEKTVSTFALRAHDKDLELLFYIGEDVPRVVMGDPARIKQILVNLLGNALKFTEQGEVVLTVERDEKEEKGSEESVNLRFAVRDTGIGIPEDRQNLLFQSFSQVDSSSTRRYEGTGLGLAISRKLVELMGGSIGVESALGKGSTFSFILPLPVAQAGDAESALTPVAAAHIKAMVIDDNQANRYILKKILESRGISVRTASAGREGLTLIQQEAEAGKPFNLVLLDQQMPEMDGFHVAAQIKEKNLLEGVPLMMLSSVDMQNNAERCRELGISSYMVKPIRQSELFNRIYEAAYQAKQADVADREIIPGAEELQADQADGAMLPKGRKLEILLVEDKAMNRRLATVLLEKKGWRVTAALSGVQALEYLPSRSFDLVLMDIQMPDMDGLEATRRIREREALTGGHIPIVAMTAHAMQGDREKCLEAGMDGYVSKPINPAELYAAVLDAVDLGEAKTVSAGSFESLAEQVFPQQASNGIEENGEDVENTARDAGGMLKTLGGDKVLLAEMMELLLEDVYGDLKQLNEHLAAGDGKNGAMVAHGIKGQLGNLSYDRGYSTARDLEKALGEERFSDGALLLERLERELKELERFFARPDWQEMV